MVVVATETMRRFPSHVGYTPDNFATVSGMAHADATPRNDPPSNQVRSYRRNVTAFYWLTVRTGWGHREADKKFEKVVNHTEQIVMLDASNWTFDFS